MTQEQLETMQKQIDQIALEVGQEIRSYRRKWMFYAGLGVGVVVGGIIVAIVRK